MTDLREKVEATINGPDKPNIIAMHVDDVRAMLAAIEPAPVTPAQAARVLADHIDNDTNAANRMIEAYVSITSLDVLASHWLSQCIRAFAQKDHEAAMKKLADMGQEWDADRYGKTKLTTIRKHVQALREAIRAEGTPAIQDAWEKVEPRVDRVFIGEDG